MKKFKRILASFMVVCMVVGLIPSSAFAADETNTLVDSAVVFSDLHTTQSDNKYSTLSGILQKMEDEGIDASSVSSSGDMFSVNETNYDCSTTDITNTIKSVYSDAEVNYVWTDHDRTSDILKESRLVYGTEKDQKYYVYLLSMADVSSWDRYSAGFYSSTEIAEHIEEFETTMAGLDKTKPLFIVGHQPLFDDRGDNGYAYQWVTAINEVAATMDVAYFHGHNHNYDEASNYYYAKGTTMSVPTTTVLSGSGYNTNLEAKDVKLNFTHINAGYMSPSTGDPSNTRKGTALGVKIYEDSINYITYNSSGEYTGSFALNETVERDFSGDVEKTVTYVDDVLSIQATALGLKDIDATNVTGTSDLSKYFTDYIAYDVSLSGHTDGNEVKYSIDFLDDMDDQNVNLYYVDDAGTLTSIPFELTTDVQGNRYIEFTTTYVGTFAYGAAAVPDGYTISELQISNLVKTDYFVGDSLDMVNPVVTAVYVKDGSPDFTRKVDMYDGSIVTDGFTISGYDMTKKGRQTVTVSYSGLTTSFVIDIFDKIFNDTTTGVSVEVTVPGPTALKVTQLESDNEVVSKAVSYALKNYVAYDIDLTGHKRGKVTTVTLPMPSGVSNPVVYYVSDDGTVTNEIAATKSEDGKTISFETDHFSTYVVGENLVPSEKDKSVTVGGTTYEEKTVYVLVDAPVADGKYLIANVDLSDTVLSEDWPNEAKGVVLLKASSGVDYEYVEVKNSSVKTADNETYSNGYIEINNTNAVWTAEANGSSWRFKNESYLRLNSGNTPVVGDEYDWAYNTTENRLTGGGRYLYFSYVNTGESAWAWKSTPNASGSSTRNIFFYKEVTAQIPTTASITYTMQVQENLIHVLDIPLENGKYVGTEKLEYNLLVDGEVASTLPTGGSYSFTPVEGENETGIISNISSDGTISFNGNEGKQYVKVAYTWTENGTAYEVYKYVVVSAEQPRYELVLHKAETTVDENGNVTASVGEEITAPIVVKNVEAGDINEDIWAVITKNGTDIGQLEEEELAKLTFTSSDVGIATVDSSTGKVTFTGKSGVVVITASYEYSDGELATDAVTFSVSDDSYYVPEDGTNDFPEYPNEGSVRFDKTATAVGNFSETGVTQIELSMTGVPYTENNRLDVVLMLDRSSSMEKATIDRVGITVDAAEAFIRNIVINEDGTFNSNRIIVADFLGGNLAQGSSHQFQSNVYTNDDEDGYDVINNETELEALIDKIEDEFVGQDTLYGTDYDNGLEVCYNALLNSKEDNNKQFCVFMSDGIPNIYKSEKTEYSSTNDIVEMFDVTDRTEETAKIVRNTSKYEYEYWSTLMKQNGATVFTVGLGLLDTNSSWRGSSEEACEQVGSYLLNDISGPAGETSAMRDTGDTLEKLDNYFFNVADSNAASEMKNVFSNIAKKIMEAAKDVRVTDSINENFTMIFQAPNSTVSKAVSNQEFYIEVKDYTLEPVYDTDGKTILDYKRSDSAVKSLIKLYMGIDGNKYYAATDAEGTNAETPSFNTTPLGSKLYWTTDATKGDSDISVVGVDGTTYYFISTGKGTHNMVSGAYANGTISSETITDDQNSSGGSVNKTSEDLIIATPYFVYNATERMLVWTVEKLTSSELALSYFLYLDNSGGYSGMDGEKLAGTYQTNNYAVLLYSNFQDRECEQYFPIPQVTWNGAQVSYVFYLVNDAGQPVNRAGKVVPFSEAVYVTNPHTYSIVWNDLEQSAGLEASYLAKDIVPSVYDLYDDDANYNIHVYENENAVNLNNHFTIGGDVTDDFNVGKKRNNANTTYVFNKKADLEKYNAVGAYKANDGNESVDSNTYYCKSDIITDAEFTVQTDGDGNKTYTVTKAIYEKKTGEEQVLASELKSTTGGTVIDGYVYYVDDNENVYTIVKKSDATEVREGFDFANTTVAFAVVWKPELVEDAVVIDYGLDVSIDVAKNDAMAASVTGVMGTQPTNVVMNNGTYSKSVGKASLDLNIDNKKVATATHESQSSVRVSLDRDNGMQLTEPLEFYYESNVNYYDEDGTLLTPNMYSSVTVIPATTVYYEDDFVDFSNYTWDYGAVKWAINSSEDKTHQWVTEGTTKTDAVQDTDRPGVRNVDDANNLYGSDSAYKDMSQYSLNSAQKINVDYDNYGEASFEFFGTGFDVISLTSNTSGFMVVDVYAWNEETKSYNTKAVKSYAVDTYYGYAYKDGKWVPVDSNDPNALYQVPVMKVEKLKYAKYKAVIQAQYRPLFDHGQYEQTAIGGSYDFYLDAIRIYDPTGVASGSTTNSTVSNAYLADNEAYPEYVELRENVISVNTFNELDESESVSGFVFIDSANSEGAENTSSVADYTNVGPNNELYLSPEQSISFELNATAKVGSVTSVQLGMKTVGGASKVDVYGINANSSEVECLDTEVNTATDMYFDITKLNGKTVVIKNTGEKILSFTNIKTTYTEAQPKTTGETASYSLLSISRASVNLAMASMEKPAKVISLDTNKELYVIGEPVDVIVKTNITTTYVIINDVKVTDYEKVNEEKIWKATVKAEKLGDVTVKAEAYDRFDRTSKEMSKTVKVEKFSPKMFTLDLSKEKTVLKEIVKATVTTSSDVEYVTINDNKITKYTSKDGKKVWTLDIESDSLGTKTVIAVACDKYGNAADPVSKSFVVEKFSPKTFKLALSKTTAVVKDKVKATVTTSDDVEYVIINGNKITKFTSKDGNRIWTLDIKTTTHGTKNVKAVAYDKYENAADSKLATYVVKKFAPKTFKLALSKTTAVVKDKVKATVTTSSDVKYVTINGKKITKFTSNKVKKTRTWTSTITYTTAGNKTVKAVAYNENESASKAVSKTVTVKKFVPKTFKMTLSKSKVKKGAKYTVTVTTSKDVKYVTLNGKKITKFTIKSGLKTFKVTYKATSVGKKTVKAVAFNTNGAKSAVKTKTVTVVKK